MPVETKYAKSGDVHIAYQVLGQGPLDLVWVAGWASHLDHQWQLPSLARYLRRLASFSRLIAFDKRGTGLSDRVAELPTLEQRMDDVRAVMDAVGSERAALFGTSEGGCMCSLFAATYPERTVALILYGAWAKRLWAPDYPWAPTPEARQAFLDSVEEQWGGEVDLSTMAPSAANDERYRKWWVDYLRLAASPGAALALGKMNTYVDIRHVLPSIRVPTLVLHRTGDRDALVEEGRYIAEHIPGAKFVELPGIDHLQWVGDQDAILDEVERFLTGVPPSALPDQVLATVLATEQVDAASTAADMGDDAWHELMLARDALLDEQMRKYRGTILRRTGGTMVATFDGPTRAIRCAIGIVDGLGNLGLQLRCGLHAGECEIVEDQLRGPAVRDAGRVMALAQPGEVLVSSTVRDLVPGSAIEFDEQNARLSGDVLGGWRIFRVASTLHTVVASGGAPTSMRSRGGQGGPLTAREREVAVLIARGLTNRQIAEELVISPGTVERHIANICNKLGYRSRAQVGVWAGEHGLLVH